MVIEIGALCAVLSASARRCEAGEVNVSLNSIEGKIMLVAERSQPPTLLFSRTVEDAVAGDLKLVPEVSHVSVERADGNLLVWIAVSNPTKEVRERIFEKQYSVIDGFPEIEFDFNIIAAKGLTPADLTSTGKIVFTREG